jgi:hypothetical protein
VLLIELPCQPRIDLGKTSIDTTFTETKRSGTGDTTKACYAFRDSCGSFAMNGRLLSKFLPPQTSLYNAVHKQKELGRRLFETFLHKG